MPVLLKTLITNLYFLVVELTITWRLGRGGGGLFKIKNSTLYLLTIFIKIYE
jgi:hypothetical protein